MIPGTPKEARWEREAPRRTLPAETLQRMVAAAFPRRRVVHAEPLAGGVRNANFKVELDGAPGAVALRVYEHDASLCAKEVDLHRLVGGSVPVPEILYAEPRGLEGGRPFTLARFIEGPSFLDLKRAGDREAIGQAARSVGETLAAIGRVRFEQAGWLGPGLAVGAPLLEGRDAVPRFLDLCLAAEALERRVPAEWRARVHRAAWRWAAELEVVDDDARLAHGDFSRRNVLLRPAGGGWEVAAVLDWEFAMAGSPLYDLGNFLRYEKDEAPLVEPHFSEGYRAAGGALAEDWRRLARLLTLTGICASLAREDLPEEVAQELAELLARVAGPIVRGDG